ncbi:MAG: gluconate 2-dehydrogenase subunit 3 family protein [Bryobacteraceae bacterium]
MSEPEISRRLVIVGGAGLVTLEAAQHVHQAAREEKAATGVYKPKFFNPHEYRSLVRLAGLIVPPDEKSKGAVEAGAPEFIDLLASRSEEMAAIHTGGLAWLDAQSKKRYGSTFADAAPAQQTALLDLIAYRKNEPPELAAGIRYFRWLRDMVVDAFYTSKIGMDDIGFMGNGAMKEFSVPAAAVQYALKRMPG